MFAAFLAAMVLIAVAFTGCGKDSDNKGGGGANSVEWDPAKTVHPDQEGAAVLLVTGDTGTPWTAEIISGAEWISFNRTAPGGQTVKTGKVGTSLSDKNQYVYYWPNNTKDERHALIRFEFEGEMPVELELVQFSTSSDDDVYETGHNLVWPEIPAKKEDGNYIYVSHFAQLNNRNMRNYTLCFDKTKRGAWWVAYPLHDVYIGSGRPSKDPWAFDPKISSLFQADLGRGSYTGSYDRGHQLPSADRLGTDEMNAQTFYMSNMTPQLNRLNQDMWAKLETKVRANNCSDTLYVVTGAYFGAGATTTTDGARNTVPVPTNYFKVLLRTKSGKTGKNIKDCSDSELISIGFWVDHKSYGNIEPPKSICTSVADIEKMTGFTFFPQVSNSVKQQNNPTQWGIN